MKTCTKCGESFEGRRCIPCKKQYDKARYLEKNEVRKTQARQYYVDNRAKVREQQGEYYRRNAERLKEYQSRYRRVEENRLRLNESKRTYTKLNPEYYRAYVNARRKRVRHVTPTWVDMGKVRAIYREAARLTELTGIKHEVDHVVPIKSHRVCGLHWEGNLQILPANLNRSKHNREWPDM